MKLIYATLKEKWPEYFLEILVLIIGIYGAFALSNYGNDKAQKRAEIEILKGCKTELMTDLAEINFNMNELKKSQNALNLIREILENDSKYHDSLASHFIYTLIPIHFVHSTSSFETAKSKGLDIISNAEIRNKLIAVYDSQYDFFLKAEQEELAEVQYNMRHILPGRFESGYNFEGKDNTFEGSMVPLDFESLKRDQEYHFFIKTQQNRTTSYISYFYENLRKSVESMIRDLDVELKNIDI